MNSTRHLYGQSHLVLLLIGVILLFTSFASASPINVVPNGSNSIDLGLLHRDATNISITVAISNNSTTEYWIKEVKGACTCFRGSKTLVRHLPSQSNIPIVLNFNLSSFANSSIWESTILVLIEDESKNTKIVSAGLSARFSNAFKAVFDPSIINAIVTGQETRTGNTHYVKINTHKQYASPSYSIRSSSDAIRAALETVDRHNVNDIYYSDRNLIIEYDYSYLTYGLNRFSVEIEAAAHERAIIQYEIRVLKLR